MGGERGNKKQEVKDRKGKQEVRYRKRGMRIDRQEEERPEVRGRKKGDRKGGARGGKGGARRQGRGKKGGRKTEAWWVQGPRHRSMLGRGSWERCVHCLNLGFWV